MKLPEKVFTIPGVQVPGLSGVAARLMLVFLICIALAVDDAAAGKLEDFEKDAIEDRRDEKSWRTERRTYGKEGHERCGGFAECFFEGITGSVFDLIVYGAGAVFVEGGRTSALRLGPASPLLDIRPREPGEPLIPYLRIDASYQATNSDVYGVDLRVEGGWAMVGAQFRETVYFENQPRDSLLLMELHALYRMSFGSSVGLNLGAGIASLQGYDNESGLSLTMPFYYHGNGMLGAELKPTLVFINGNTIVDTDASVIATFNRFSISAGYRSLKSPNQTIEGPYAGVSVVW